MLCYRQYSLFPRTHSYCAAKEQRVGSYIRTLMVFIISLCLCDPCLNHTVDLCLFLSNYTKMVKGADIISMKLIFCVAL